MEVVQPVTAGTQACRTSPAALVHARAQTYTTATPDTTTRMDRTVAVVNRLLSQANSTRHTKGIMSSLDIWVGRK